MASYYDRKDYSRPLHVDCSVEYELPNAAKPPAGSRTEPLLMIHPCYYRRAESQRRSPFINNLPATRPQYPVRYPKREPLLGSGDSGVSGLGHWDTTASPDRLHAGPDSGIQEDKGLPVLTGSCWDSTEPTSARLFGSSRCQTNTEGSREPKFLGVEVNNNSESSKERRPHQQQPAVAVAAVAVAACRACQPQFLQPQTRHPWPAVTAPLPCSTRHRSRAVEPGPEHAAARRPLPAWPAPAPAPPVKRSRLLPPANPADCCKICAQSQWSYPQCRAPQDNSRVLWNNENMLRLYQV